VSAGDMIGASPLLSALFHDEPTVMAFNQMGFDFSNVGNHEFDEGWQELLRMQNGGCHPIDGCFPGVPEFPGASFKYMAGNVIQLDNGQTLFPAYGVREFDGVKVGFIGISLESTPTIVVASGVDGLLFEAEVDTINHYVKVLKDTEDLKAIVVILHDGAGAGPTINSCKLTDPFFTNVVMNLDPEIDALITGHTHNAYNCQVQVKKNYDPMIVTGAGYNGRYLTDIDLTIDGTNGQVIGRTATNIPVETPFLSAVPDPAMKALIELFKTASDPLANRVVGSITADITRGGNMEESALGDVIADAQLAATIDPANGNAVIAMTNPGGIRTNLLFDQISGGELPGEVTYGEAFAVQPFSNSLVTLTLKGAQLKAVLEQQATAGSDGSGRMLQISYSLKYTWTTSAPVGSKVSYLKINGVDVDPSASYRVTVNNFLAGGGDGFTALVDGTDLLTGMIDLDAFVAYLTANSPVPPGLQDSISIVP
ncbi:MAG: bifunctional metallophosphatase/5'-nucleotidase, partial [Anaerolineaceae bacterium]|nr:bifunctional metallophosphatase/5'-nucleotidase [Anaerolineaceae bacterium]